MNGSASTAEDWRPARRPGAASTWKRLAHLVRPDLAPMLAGIGCGLLAGGGRLFFPQAIRLAFDSERIGLGLLGLILAALGLEGFGRLGEKLFFNAAAHGSVGRLRCAVFDHLLQQEVGWFDDQRTGDLVSRMMADAQALETMLIDEAGTVTRCLLVALGGSAVLLWLSPALTAIMLLGVVPLVVVLDRLGRRTGAFWRLYHERMGDLSGLASEHIAGIRTVRACDQEAAVSRRFAAHSLACVEAGCAANRVNGLVRALATVGAELVAVAVVLAARPALGVGALTTGAVAAFVVTGLVTLEAYRDLAVSATELRRASGTLARVLELGERAPRVPRAEGARPDPVVGHVAFEGVRFRYPSRPEAPVLESVDLTLEPGENVALVGASGAGKSTLVGLLLRFQDPDGGQVVFDGRDTRTLDGSWLRRRIGFVGQEPVLFSATIADNVRFGREDASNAEVESAARAANAHEFVARLPEGYATRVGERGVHLSGGQRQRIAIARAVLKDPRVLVLDEATSALDSESEFLVQEALERLMAGRTTLIIAHRLSTVSRAGRVAVLAGGRIVEEGTHEALLAAGGPYAQLVERQLFAG